MEIPLELRDALEHQTTGIKVQQMMHDTQAISLRYKTQSGKGEPLLSTYTEALSYAIARMPATFGTVSFALKNALTSIRCHPQTLLDVGAGTGAVAWAAVNELDLKSITCLEREEAMYRIGETLMKQGSQVLRDAKWITFDLTEGEIPEQADLVVASYVLNEMTDNGRINVMKKLWDATKMMLLLIEPGTPVGFSNILEARQMLLKYGAHIAAPCEHEGDCPKSQNDWCHFTCRINRSRLHRQLKGGDAPYEDEKFIYMALTREECCNTGARIVRHPQVRSGHVLIEVCTMDGIQNIKLSKKDGERYKQARKAVSGDAINY